VLLEANLAPFFIDFRGTRATLADDTNTAFSGSSRHKRKKIKVMHPEIAGAKSNFERTHSGKDAGRLAGGESRVRFAVDFGASND
jgi:hypothetical protein